MKTHPRSNSDPKTLIRARAFGHVPSKPHLRKVQKNGKLRGARNHDNAAKKSTEGRMRAETVRGLRKDEGTLEPNEGTASQAQTSPQLERGTRCRKMSTLVERHNGEDGWRGKKASCF